MTLMMFNPVESAVVPETAMLGWMIAPVLCVAARAAGSSASCNLIHTPEVEAWFGVILIGMTPQPRL
jgi:hypothetical protein